MSDKDLWERRFLTALGRLAPEAPPQAAFLFRRRAIARIWPGDARAALLVAAAEVLQEELRSSGRVHECLRMALAIAPTSMSIDWLWNAGRGDLIVLASPFPGPTAMQRLPGHLARVALPVLAAATLAAMSCPP